MYRIVRIALFSAISLLLLANSNILWAQESSDICTPVAKAFERTFCLEEITVDKEHVDAIKLQYEEQGLNSEQALDSKSLEALKDLIWLSALEIRFGKNSISPTKEETDLYSKAFKATLDKNHLENQQTAKKIEALLQGDTYNERDKAKLRKLLTSIKTSIAFYNERENYNKDMPPEFHEMVSEAERGIAQKMVRDWKVDRALYNSYGGKVISLKSRLEPIGAYEQFLGYIKQEGALSVVHDDYKDVFKQLELYIEKAKSLDIEEDKELYKNYFSDIRWQFENGDRITQY